MTTKGWRGVNVRDARGLLLAARRAVRAYFLRFAGTIWGSEQVRQLITEARCDIQEFRLFVRVFVMQRPSSSKDDIHRSLLSLAHRAWEHGSGSVVATIFRIPRTLNLTIISDRV